MRARVVAISVLLAACPRAGEPRDAGVQPRAVSVPEAPPAPVDSGSTLATLATDEPSIVIAQHLRAFVTEAEATQLEAHLAQTAKELHVRLSRVGTCEGEEVLLSLSSFIAENLQQKHASKFPLDVARIRRQVIDAEAWKLETFVATGVYPRRYFGYVDEQFDTAPFETRLKKTVRDTARACNRWLKAQKSGLRVTEAEILVTFLAEGGAELLREKQSQLESIHPVLGIGLDDIAKGFVDLAPLVTLLDAEAGTHLQEIVVWQDQTPYLSRNFRFEEAIAGTAAMWVWEKQIAERKLLAQNRPSLSMRPLDEQWVITSLIYNSGILFDELTIQRIKKLETGTYIFNLSKKMKAKRWPLPVYAPKDALALMMGGGRYPEQPTSWSTVYHLLQRHGGYVGLMRFTDAFDEETGALR